MQLLKKYAKKITEANERFQKQQTSLEEERETLQKRVEHEISARHETALRFTDMENLYKESEAQADAMRKELSELRTAFQNVESKFEESDQKLLSLRQEKLSYEAGHMREQTRLKASLEEAWEHWKSSASALRNIMSN